MRDAASIQNPNEIFQEKPVIAPFESKHELKGTEREYKVEEYLGEDEMMRIDKQIKSFFNNEGIYHLSDRESKGWQKFATELAAKKINYEPSPTEQAKLLADAILDIPQIVEIQRKKLIDKIEDVDDNITLVEWQQTVIKMIQRLDMLEGGKDIIDHFWEYWTTICGKRLNEEEANKRRAGIIGVLAFGRLMDKLDYDCYFAKPTQDAKEAIDIFIVDRNAGIKRGIIAAQAKGESRGILSLGIEKVRPFIPTRGQGLTKEQLDRRRLLTFAQEYDTIWKSQGVDGGVHPAWIAVSGIGPSSLQGEVDYSTGTISRSGLRYFNLDATESRIEKLFEQQGGLT